MPITSLHCRSRKMRYTLISLCCLLFVSTFLPAQTSADNVVGQNFKINSEWLGQERQIQVFLPDGYDEEPSKRYPVIYLLDGQRFYLYGVSLSRTLHQMNQTPDFIVVGITNQETKRMQTFSSGSEAFGQFIAKELVPFIDQSYRTSDRRALFGWAYGGGFALNMLMETTDLFDGYILSSPFPTADKAENLGTILRSQPSRDTFLFFSSNEVEPGVKEGVEALVYVLSQHSVNLRWNYHLLKGEEHISTPYPTLFHGLKAYFDHYSELRFDSLIQFEEMGGMSYISDYYQLRKEKYGLSDTMGLFYQYALIRLAIREDNPDQVNYFMTQFGEAELLVRLSEGRACSVADYYVSKGETSRARELYQDLVGAHPDWKRAASRLQNL